ncbi:MAG: hypothetical protein M3203_08925 [Actinomycetota bacterium]|nr:hypothetical protein [Actinomycetota bacterium]
MTVAETGEVDRGASAHVPGTDAVRTDTSRASDEGTWVLQTDAAARTGFSVSAIRKWRRMGLVAERKLTSASGFERVEVKLEDVLARAAMQPERRRTESSSPDGHPAPGTVVIAIDDLEALFERMVTAERRAEEAEAAAEAQRAQATFTFGQIAELRRQLQDATGAPGETGSEASPSRPDPPRPDTEPTPLRPPPAPRLPAPPPAVARSARTVQPVRPSPSPPPYDHSPPDLAAGPPPRSRVEELGDELRRIYGRLDEYRRQPVLTPEAERRHQRDLAEYDRVLVLVCEAMGIPTGLQDGEPVGAEVRAGLTRALARAGLDVRDGTVTARRVRRPRIPGNRRS